MTIIATKTSGRFTHRFTSVEVCRSADCACGWNMSAVLSGGERVIRKRIVRGG